MARKAKEGKIPSEIGVLLKKARERRRMTQADLARAARVSTRTLHSLETGEWLTVRDAVLIRLALALKESPEEWLAKAGHEFDADKVARIKEAQRHAPPGLVEPDILPENRGSLDAYLAREASVKADHPDAKCEIWVIDAHEPPEVRDLKVLDVVCDNVRKGVTYRYFFPVGSETRPLDWHSWGFNHREAIEGIRKRVVPTVKSKSDSAPGQVLEHAIDPTEFPLFLFNVGTVILYITSNIAESEQHCYRIVNVLVPRKAWYYQEEASVASELIRFLRQKITRSEQGK